MDPLPDRLTMDRMPAEATSGRVRLAELVGALSLGIDLGFGQPMEHVLRQCLIALRLAARVGLEEEERAVVYYTALLINVGCHTDAHEQAKWFGDDIEMRSHKYDPEFQAGPLRAALHGLSSIGAGQPPLHRFRIGLEFMISGHRETHGMIAAHAAIARTLAEQLGLPRKTMDAIGSSYEFWDGKGWPGLISGAEIPIAARIASLSEHIEVAHRIGGLRRVVEFTARSGGKQFDPALCKLLHDEGNALLDGVDSVQVWQSVIDQNPRWRSSSATSSSMRRCSRSQTSST